jgi:hypothetical protein
MNRYKLLCIILFSFLLFHTQVLAFRVYPTTAQDLRMLDKSNFPFIAENADGFNVQYDSFTPFSAEQVAIIFNQFTNKNLINHGVYNGTPIVNISSMPKVPAFANVTALMLYNEAPAMDSTEWKSALSQNVPWPLITHCRAFSEASSSDEVRKQIMISSGCMMEFMVTDPSKFVDAAKLTRFCVDNNKMVVFLTTFQRSPDIFISAYKEFFYYLKENLGATYLNSDNVIFVPNTYTDSQVFPETIGYGSTFGVAHWLIEQKTKNENGYIQPKIAFTSVQDENNYPNHTNLSVQLNVSGSVAITNVKLYVNNILVGEDAEAPYSWSGGILNNLTTGYKEIKAVALDVNGNETSKAIQVRILDDPQTVPGSFLPDALSNYSARNAPLSNGGFRHVYAYEWIDYTLNVAHTGIYDIDVALSISRSKQYGGTIIIQKGTTELGSFTTILNDPAQPALPGFTENPAVVIKNVPLTAGVQTLRITFSRPGGGVMTQFALWNFNFRIKGSPDIAFTLPAKNSVNGYDSFNAPANIAIAANISSPRAGGLLKTVSLFRNNVLVDTRTEGPYTWNSNGLNASMNNLPAGNHVFKIVATDELGYASFKELELQVVDRIPFNPNLQIPGVIKGWEFDIGGEGVAYHDFNEGLERGLGGDQNPRFAKAGQEDVEVEISAGDYCVSGIRRNEWLNYNISNIQKGTYDIIINSAANTGKSCNVKVWLNNKLIATVPTSATGSDFTNFRDFKVSGIVIPEDMQKANIRLEFINSAITTYLLFLRKFEFVKTADVSALRNTEFNNKLKIYPNPAINIVNVLFESQLPYGVNISNLSGKIIYRKNEIHTNTYTIKTGSIDAGTYLIQINSKEYGTITQKLIIKH